MAPRFDVALCFCKTGSLAAFPYDINTEFLFPLSVCNGSFQHPHSAELNLTGLVEVWWLAGLRGQCMGREVYTAKERRNRKTKLSSVRNSRGKAIKFGSETARWNPGGRGGVRESCKKKSERLQKRRDVNWKCCKPADRLSLNSSVRLKTLSWAKADK